jgi:hypothetical protein
VCFDSAYRHQPRRIQLRKFASGAFDECCHCQQGHLLQIFESGSCQGFFATVDAAAAAKALADTPRADFGL